MKKYIIAILIVLVFLSAGVARRFAQLGSATAIENITSIQKQVGIPVKASKPRLTEVGATFEFLGSVEAFREAGVNAKIEERITSSSLELGRFIRQDEVVVQLFDETILTQGELVKANLMQARAGLEKARNGARPEEINQSKANVEAMEAQFESARQEFERTQRLQKADAIPPQKAEKVESAFVAAKAQLGAAQQQLKLVKTATRREDLQMAEALAAQAEAQLRLAMIQLSYTKIRAPFSGFVSHIYVQVGEETGKGKPVFDLVDIDRVYLLVDVTESQILKIARDQKVVCFLDSLPGVEFPGSVAEIGPKADPVSRTFPVKILVPNPDHKFRPGMLARARIRSESPRNALLVPLTALRGINGREGIFLASEGKARFTAVSTGLRETGMVEVTSGVGSDSEVIFAGSQGLSDGAAIFLSEEAGR